MSRWVMPRLLEISELYPAFAGFPEMFVEFCANSDFEAAEDKWQRGLAAHRSLMARERGCHEAEVDWEDSAYRMIKQYWPVAYLGWLRAGSPPIRLRGAVVVAVHEFRDVRLVADSFRSDMAVVVDVRGGGNRFVGRVVDFCDGVAFAHGGRMEQIGDTSLLLINSESTLQDHDVVALLSLGFRVR